MKPLTAKEYDMVVCDFIAGRISLEEFVSVTPPIEPPPRRSAMPKVLTKVRAAVPVFIGGATGGAMTAILLPALGPFACVVSILTGAAVGVGVEKILPRRSQ